MKGILRAFVGGVLGGLLGGVLVGFGESILVVLTSASADEYWLFLFGAVAYGLFGGVLGAGAAVAWNIVRGNRTDMGGGSEAGAFAAVFLPVLAVGRYHVSRRIFHEQLVLTSGAGLLAHVLLLVGAVAAGVLAVWLVRKARGKAGVPGVVLLMVLLVAFAWGIGVTTEKKEAPRADRYAPAAGKGLPNVILVIVDAMRADGSELYGGPRGSTPALVSLARDGVVFDHVRSQSSWTRPSIASILTGVYASVHGTMGKLDMLPDSVLTVAETFKAHGYWTAGFVTNINVAPVFNFQQGFDEYRYLEPSFYFGATDSATKLSIYKGLRVARERFLASRRMYFYHYYQDAEVLTKMAHEWLASGPPEPFFLLLHYMDVHDPYFEIPYNGHGVARVMTPNPPADRAQELHRIYAGEVHYFDQWFAKVLQDLRKSGLYDRSVIAVTADHGEEFHEHGGWWHGTSLYEEVVHVPLIVKRASEPLAGSRREDPVRLIDVAPSLVAAAGFSPPTDFLGKDLFSGPIGEPVLAEESLEGNELLSLVSGPWKIITANPGNPRGLKPVELYNLETDPGEKTNLADQEPERVQRMLDELKRMRARIAQGRMEHVGM